MQISIQNPVSCYGIGVHSGKVTQLTLRPAKKDTGVLFVRTDITEGNVIEACYSNVHDTALSTCVANSNKASVSTIEHLMAAIWACGIDNIIVELDGPEVPIMDGSSKPFIFMLECAGKKALNAPRKSLKILKEIRVANKDSELIAVPSEYFQLDLTIDFENQVIGKQSFTLDNQNSPAQDTFKEQIADARTFGFVHELEYLKSKGLAQGASLDNAIGIDQDTILNHNGLKYNDEFVRHKLLDLVGDLYTARSPIIASITGYKTGHALNNQFLRHVFENPYCYEWVAR